MTLLENPIFRREGIPRFWRDASPGMRLIFLIAYLALAFAPALFIVMLREVIPPELSLLAFYASLYWPSFLMPAIVPALMANAIASERERRTWEGLLLSQMTAWEILSAKLVSRMMLLVWITLACAPVFLALYINSWGHSLTSVSTGHSSAATYSFLGSEEQIRFMLAALLGIPVTMANAVMTLYVSMRCANTRTATLIAYGIAGGAYFFLTIVSGLILFLLVFIIRDSSPGYGSNSSEILTAIIQAGIPLAWGILVPIILIPRMIRHFDQINAKVSS